MAKKMMHKPCGMAGCNKHKSKMEIGEHEDHHYAKGNDHSSFANEYMGKAESAATVGKSTAGHMAKAASHMAFYSQHYKAASKLSKMH